MPLAKTNEATFAQAVAARLAAAIDPDTLTPGQVVAVAEALHIDPWPLLLRTAEDLVKPDTERRSQQVDLIEAERAFAGQLPPQCGVGDS